jgi:Leucine-rich repeat (LRR) protein
VASHVIVRSSLYGNETDRLSLLEFKDEVSLDPRQAFMSWNDSTHVFNWEGVLCRMKNSLHRVTSLDLTSRGVVAHISPSLGNLTFLQSLSLTDNTLSGEIPPSLGHLHRLHNLRLNNNTLQGSVLSFANCPKLRVLDVSVNNLVGQFPSVQVLRISVNNLTGTIPTSLANITTLTMIAAHIITSREISQASLHICPACSTCMRVSISWQAGFHKPS